MESDLNGMGLTLGVLGAYFLPSLIAWARSTPARVQNGVCVVNLLLGWTGLGWVWALVWAVSAEVSGD